MLDTAKALYQGSAQEVPARFNPRFSYLRTQIGDRTIYMVLGYVDKNPDGPVEVWYSSSGEVIRLQNGRIVGTTGLALDWREVRFSGWPSWSTQTSSEQQTYVRERDLMPGYRFGVRDEVTRTPIPTPRRTALSGTDANALRWYEERSLSRPAAASLPVARFGVVSREGRDVVVYSEQCISNSICMSFERWTPPTPAAGTAASAGT